MKDAAANIQIRRATVDQAGLVASILRQAFAEFESLYTEQAFAATVLATDAILARMREGPVWCALCEKRIVGTASAVRRETGTYVRGVAVIPAARGLGIGRLLLQEIETFANANRSHRLFLTTTPFLTEAIRLYEHLGFQRTSAGRVEFFGTPLFTMEKMLTRNQRRERGLD